MHPLRSSRWEAGQRQAKREQAGGSRETGRLKQAMGATEEHGQHVTMFTFKKSHFKSAASRCGFSEAMTRGQPQKNY